MNLPKPVKQIIRTIFPFQLRVNFLRKRQVLKTVFNLNRQAIRDDSELVAAREFMSYMEALDQTARKVIIDKLKDGLDSSSQNVVDCFIANHDYILKHNLLDTRVLFSKQDLIEQAECSLEFAAIRKWLFLFNFKNYNPESFYGLNGLRWLPEVSKARLRGGVLFDVGAYDSDSSVSLASVFEPAIIYAFEPEPHNFNRLVANGEILGNKIIQPVQLGVFSQSGESLITSKESGSKISSSIGDKIRLTTIDDFVAAKDIQKVDLIKLDIEGDELAALYGAIDTIKRLRPILAISIYHQPNDFFKIKPWLQEICPDYQFIIKKSHPFAFNRETMLLAY